MASLVQLLLFYITHQTLKNLLLCFGVDIKEYHNLSLPEITPQNLKSYILSLQKVIQDEDSEDDSTKELGPNESAGGNSETRGSKWISEFNDQYDFSDDITSNLKPLDLKLTLNAVSQFLQYSSQRKESK